MTHMPLRLLLALACGSATSPASAQEQAPTELPQPSQVRSAGQELAALDRRQLYGEIETRFQQAVALSADPAVVAADSARYIWAVEAKIQCGIALGYLKSGHKDPISLGKCADFAAGMNGQTGAMSAPSGTEPGAPMSGRDDGPGSPAFARPATRPALASGDRLAGADRAAPTITAN